MLIVGAGPVGLALATDLGWRGVPCLAIEQGEGVADHPRASALDARTMEFLRRWGLAEAVREAGTPEDFPHTALYCTKLTGFEIARIERPGHGGRAPSAISPERPQRCNQLWLDPILRDAAEAMPASQSTSAGASRACAKTATTCMIATVHDLARDERRQIVARFVIDCSGGRSPIRQALGIGMSGSPYLGYFVSIFVRAPELWKHHNMGKAALISFVEPEGIWRNMVMLDGRELYRFGVRGKNFYDDPDKIDAERLFAEVVGKKVPHEFISVRRWTARNVVSDIYQVGRIFLAGDAAHLNHPAGLGLDTGLGDVVDLGWKLERRSPAGAVRDCSGPTRASGRPVGQRNVGHADAAHAFDREQARPESRPIRRKARAPAAKWAKAWCARRPRRSSPTGSRSAIDTIRPQSAGPTASRRRPTRSPTIIRPPRPAAARRMRGLRTVAPSLICSAAVSCYCGSATTHPIRPRSSGRSAIVACR